MDGEVGALSAGRSRRSTAGNRMRDLLEQERERLESRADEEDDEMFREEEGDIDFEARAEEGEDIVDSDFDQSSAEEADGDDELGGERAIEEEERAAKRANRAKAAPVGVRRPAVVAKPPQPPRPSTSTAGVDEQHVRPAKRPLATRLDAGKHRSSQRKSTMDATLTVQARLKVEEKRRQEASERAAPKRKKAKLSQADRIAEALEMEEQNRESLKKYLELEEQRREKDRRKGKRRMEGGWLRYKSIAESRGQKAMGRIGGEPRQHAEASTNGTLTVDPVIAAREAAKREREAVNGSSHLPADGGEEGTAVSADAKPAHSRTSTASEVAPQETSTLHSAATTEKGEEMAGVVGDEVGDDRGPVFEDASQVPPEGQVNGMVKAKSEEPEYETRTYVSLHQLSDDTGWQTYYSHLLGSHVNWSQYLIVPARNRPLRPRQSVCAITGLPALYRDPRSGIAYANQEAYETLTRVMACRYQWTGRPMEGEEGPRSSVDSVAVNRSYEPMEMGCWLGSLDEPGACNVLSIAAGGKEAAVGVAMGAKDAVAPSDELAIIAAAQALPAGTTRSGGRRRAK